MTPAEWLTVVPPAGNARILYRLVLGVEILAVTFPTFSWCA